MVKYAFITASDLDLEFPENRDFIALNPLQIKQYHMVYLESGPPMDLSVFGNIASISAHAANIQLNGIDLKSAH